MAEYTQCWTIESDIYSEINEIWGTNKPLQNDL